uniref:RNA polymerase II subunit A C-terminal domain phosphatase SSU72 n=1 Tax=Tetraselmis sp. GSL018 TaxID=582737 RepID=A0A061RLN1_9CHLO
MVESRLSNLRYAMVCASNQNRSMEAHALLKEHNFRVGSYGVGQHVKLPGASAKEPNVYGFGTPYKRIYEELSAKDPELYTRNGLLKMLHRNMGVKTAPERWQDCRDRYDVVVCFEERVFDACVDDLQKREQSLCRSVLVVNLEVKDNHEEAANAAPHALRLCQMLDASEDWEEEIDAILNVFEKETGRRPLYTICFY